jgi:hypothetical protein
VHHGHLLNIEKYAFLTVSSAVLSRAAAASVSRIGRHPKSRQRPLATMPTLFHWLMQDALPIEGMEFFPRAKRIGKP